MFKTAQTSAVFVFKKNLFCSNYLNFRPCVIKFAVKYICNMKKGLGKGVKTVRDYLFTTDQTLLDGSPPFYLGDKKFSVKHFNQSFRF